MKNLKQIIIKQIIIAIALISIGVFATYSIRLFCYRAYTGSLFNFSLLWYEKLSVRIGLFLCVFVIIFFIYLFFIGVNTFYNNNKYIAKYNINKVLVNLFFIWFFYIGIFVFAVSGIGRGFILEPFYGPKINYGGYGNTINAIEFRIKLLEDDKGIYKKGLDEKTAYLNDEEKKKEIERLKTLLRQIIGEMEKEERFNNSQQELRYIKYKR